MFSLIAFSHLISFYLKKERSVWWQSNSKQGYIKKSHKGTPWMWLSKRQRVRLLRIAQSLGADPVKFQPCWFCVCCEVLNIEPRQSKLNKIIFIKQLWMCMMLLLLIELVNPSIWPVQISKCNKKHYWNWSLAALGGREVVYTLAKDTNNALWRVSGESLQIFMFAQEMQHILGECVGGFAEGRGVGSVCVGAEFYI